MRIYESLINKPLFEIQIKAPTRQSAEEACKKWRQSAPNIWVTSCVIITCVFFKMNKDGSLQRRKRIKDKEIAKLLKMANI